ncbi:MAG: hypothetical protein LBH30_03155 [Prevotellaceae bacterium]|jgi:hypothetical protein|nr:hypothetical protein [Prevotellaceae bacterium]
MKRAKKDEPTPVARYKQEKINRENLCTAIRCFFEIDRKAKPQTNNIIVCLYLAMIYEKVNFADRYYQKPYFAVFSQWINQYSSAGMWINRELTGTHPPETLPAWQMRTIKAHFINLLTGEICADLEAGLYTLQAFIPTQAEKRKKQAEMCKEYGITPPKRKRKKNNRANIERI